MIHFTEAAQAALLNWINTFELPRKAESLDNLQDGLIFGEVLNALCADYGADGVTLNKNAASWPEKKHNLETVYRGLARLLRQDNPHLAPAAAQFRAIADNPNENGMCEFISAFVAATCLGSLSQNYIPKILKLNKNDQQEIAKVIMRKEEQRNEARKIEDEREEESRREEKYIDNDAFEAARDQDLAREEALLKLKKEVEKLRKQNADLHSRHDSLLEKHALLNAALRKAETELEAQRMTGSTTVPKFIQQLEEEKRENTALIDTLQAQVNDYEQEIVKLRRENTSLQAKADRVKDLDDKVKILEYEKKENEKMERVLENYKKKAQESTTYQHQIRELQAKNDELQAATSEYESLRLTKQTLEDTIEAFREKVADYEQSLHEQSVFRTSLQDTINDLRAQLESLQSRHNIDEAHIKDLEEKLQMGGGSFTQRSSSPDQSASFNLEQELETTADPTTALRLEVSRLKTENNVLRNMTVQTEAQRLREDLELVTRKADHLSTQNSDLVEKHALAQEQISALVSKVPAEREEAAVQLRLNLQKTNSELEEARAKIQELEAKVAEAQRDLVTVKADLTAVGQESIDALEVIKSTDQLTSNQLKVELDVVRRQLETKEFDNEQMRTQLMETLISKDKLRKQLDDVAAVPAEDAQKQKKEDSEKTAKLKAALKQTVQQVEKLEQDKYELQRRIKAVESGGALAAQKAANEQIIRSLQRENAMITSAWYDLTSRLQSNHVVLQRRHDVPKSWLNKQRQMVNATPRR